MAEDFVYDAHPPMFRNNPIGFILSVLLIPAGIGILILLYWYVKSRSERLTLTTEELRYEKGLLSKDRSELKLTAIRSVRAYQSLFQRMFGTGNIEIYSAGDTPEMVLKGMPDPNEIRELIRQHS